MNDATSAKERSLGDIIRAHGNLSADKVEAILEYQRKQGVRFGEAAVALGLVSRDELMAALSEQFSYPVSAAAGGEARAELMVLSQPFTAQAESIRAVRSRLLMLSAGGKAEPVAVVSPDSADGKSYFAANLACALAQMGQRTLLIDADMRSPRLHEIFGVNNGAGLSGLLAGRADGAAAIRPVDGLPELCLLPVGATPPNPLELLERPGFGRLLGEAVERFDQVIVDTASVAQGADALVAAARCGRAIVLARRDHTRMKALRELGDALSFAAVKVAGLVYNDC